jgi:hypothetical protein
VRFCPGRSRQHSGPREFVGGHDDHSLLYSFAGLITINRLLHQQLPCDPARDLVPIATTSDNFLVIATSAKLHVNSLVSMILIFVSVRRALRPGH